MEQQRSGRDDGVYASGLVVDSSILNTIYNKAPVLLLSFFLLFCNFFSGICQSKDLLVSTQLFCELPTSCPTPDSFTLTSDGKLILTCPNFAVKAAPGRLMQLNEKGDFFELGDFQLDGETVNVRPMGIVGSDDGALFMCGSLAGKGMVFKVEIGSGHVLLEVIASGLQGANGIKYSNGDIYVTTPSLPKIKTSKNVSGLYCFKVSDRDILINGDSTDQNLIFTVETQNPDRQFGLDGIAINSKGEVFVGDFGDAVIYRLKMRDGHVKKAKPFCALSNTTGVDGICFDSEDNLYIAGFSQNEIWVKDKFKDVRLLAKNADSTGQKGELDQPADVFVYENKLLISNFDLMVTEGMINSGHQAPYTISFIDLK